MPDRLPRHSPWWAGWRLSVALLAFVIVGGTLGYVVIEGWSLWDAFYMTMISVTTAGYITDVLADRTVRFLQENRKRPFFCYVPFNAPHSPHQAPEKLVSKYLKKGLDLENAEIYAMIDSLDENIGEILKAVDDLGLRKDTLVVFTADQGFGMGEHGFRTKLAPYDATYRSPLIVSMPGTLPRGKVAPQCVAGADLVVTFFAVAGIELPWAMHGRDLTPLLKDPDAPWPHPAFYEFTGDHFGSDVSRVVAGAPRSRSTQ